MKKHLTTILISITFFILISDPTIAHPGWGIEHDSKGNLFFTDIVNKTIWKLDASGTLSVFSEEKWSHQLMIDKDDNIFICNEEYKIGNGWNSVIKISPDGDESYFILPTKYGKEFSGTLIAIDDNENVYFEYKHNIYKRTPDGDRSLFTTKTFKGITNLKYLNGSLYIVDKYEIYKIEGDKNLSVIANNFINPNPIDGAYEGQYNRITCINVDDEGNLLLAYYGNSRVLKVLEDGTIEEIYSAKGDWYPMGIEYHNNNLFILEEGHAPEDGPTALRIIKLNSEGKGEILVAMGHIGGKSVK